MSPPIKQVTFAGGEISPALYARTDVARYENSLRTMRNYVSMRHGGATQRPGTMYVGTTLNGGNQIRLIPFIFNETGLGQSYLLEFGNQYIAFYQNGGVVISGGVPYKISSPYLQADLATLQFAQSADVLTLVHQNYAPMELKRLGAINWTIGAIPFASFPGPTFVTVPSFTAGSRSYWYIVTAIDVNGNETDLVTAYANNGVGGIKTLIAAPSPTTPVTVAWTARANAVSYRVYKQDITGSSNFSFGFVYQTVDTVFSDLGYTPDYTNQAPTANSFFSTPGNYPSSVGYSQQRRVFANTLNNPIGFWESQPGLPYNFDTHLFPVDSDAIIASIAGQEVNAIQHVMELKFMLILTAGAEIYVQGNGSGVVTPSAINASVQSQYGCSPLQPLKVGDILIFNQALGSFVRDFAFDFSIDGYRGNDITVFAAHLFEGYQLTDWAYQKVPDSIIWAARSDGTLLSCTYVREQQVLAWSHHDLTNGFVENVCTIPENGAYAVYLSIRRVINGLTVRYIERMSSRIWQDPTGVYALGDPINATYLDCFSSFNGRNASAGILLSLRSNSGPFATGPTAYQQVLTLVSNRPGAFPTFFPNMVGDQIFMEDALFISSQGTIGNQIKCTIQTYIDDETVQVTPSGAVPVDLQNVFISTWAHAVKSVSGLGYLQGQQVSVYADRFVVGSPLNTTIKTIYTVPPSGIITLDKCYAVIYVGLPMMADLETLDIDTGFGETELGKRKHTIKLGIYTYQTRSFFAGSENPDLNRNNTANDPLFQLYPLITGDEMQSYTDPPDLNTEQDFIYLESRWNLNGRLFMRNPDPIPVTILAISPGGEDPVQQPYGKKV